MKTPLTKAARHHLIVRSLQSRIVRSQGELQRALAEAGIEVTQATLSRDLDELKATKVRDASGVLRYTVSDYKYLQTGRHTPASIPGKLSRWCAEFLIDAQVAANQLLLRTPLGGASVLAAVIDKESPPGVLGSIAGDDTILVVCTDAQVAAGLHRQLLQLANTRTQAVTSKEEIPEYIPISKQENEQARRPNA